MTTPSPLLELVERFDRNRQAYRSGHYNETQVRREFIDPFFEALGWDVANKQGCLDRWDEIAGVFGRDAILRGSFDKYVESTTSKRGTAEVDRAFLAEIERWRDLLAHTIALLNAGLY